MKRQLPNKRKCRVVMLKFKMIMVLLLLCLLGTAYAEAPDENSVESFFKAFKEKRDGIGSLKAHFVQRTVLPDEVITTEGTLYYSRPRRIMFKTETPDRATLVDNRRGYEYDAEIKQLTIFDIEDQPQANIFFLGFDDDTDALQQAYQVQLMITHDARGMHGIKIAPRPDTHDEVYFMEVNLFLREEDYLPYRIHIVNDTESEVFIDIDTIEPQPSPDLESIRILVPPGVKVIENDRVVETVQKNQYFPANDVPPQLEATTLPEQPQQTE